MAPFLVNTLLAILFYAVAAVTIEASQLVGLLFGWLGVSTAWHAIPSTGDTKNVWRSAIDNCSSSVVAAATLPVALFLFIANALRYVWFDALYAAGLAILVFVLLPV